MTLTLRYAARSDRGLIRSGNQDSVYAGPRLLAVADGMGGMAAGDVASNIVIATMAPLDEDVPGNAMIDTLRGAVDLANQQIRDAVEANPAMEGMGTTLTAMLFSGSKMGMVHIGDSRAYILRDGEFAQVTKDDTYVQMLVDEGVTGDVLVERGHGADDDIARDVTGGHAAHAVGNGEQPRSGVDGVLISVPDQTAVASSRIAQGEGHGRNSREVRPMRIGTPRGTGVGPVTLARSRYVPFVEPRSSTNHCPDLGTSRA